MMSECDIVVCVRIADSRGHVVDSVRVPCSVCSAACWRAPTSPPGLPVICLVCARRMGEFIVLPHEGTFDPEAKP